jgi:hypothetical protein
VFNFAAGETQKGKPCKYLLANIIQQSIGTEIPWIGVLREAVHVPSVIQAGGQIPTFEIVYTEGAPQYRHVVIVHA